MLYIMSTVFAMSAKYTEFHLCLGTYIVPLVVQKIMKAQDSLKFHVVSVRNLQSAPQPFELHLFWVSTLRILHL